MKRDYSKLSEKELNEMINSAEQVLQSKKEDRRKEVIKQIKELAKTIGVTVEIVDRKKKQSSRKGIKVPAKYHNPKNPSQQWTGRGMKPKWLQALLDKGNSIDKYKI